jgi:choline-glycine betaine transporter
LDGVAGAFFFARTPQRKGAGTVGGSETGSKRKELNALGWLLALGGMAVAVLTYIGFGIGNFFAGLDGLLGLNEMTWLVFGGVIWMFVIMAIVSVVVGRVGIKG